MSIVTCPNCGHRHETTAKKVTRKPRQSPAVAAFLKIKFPVGLAANYREAGVNLFSYPNMSPEAANQFAYKMTGGRDLRVLTDDGKTTYVRKGKPEQVLAGARA